MSVAQERFDTIYVIGDLELRLDTPSAASTGVAALEALVDEIVQRPPGERVALVLNGNTFDLRKYEMDAQPVAGLLADAPQPGIGRWLAPLRQLLDTRDRRLLMLPGNSDPQLLLPEVEAALLARLDKGDTRASKRFCVPTVGRRGDVRLHVGDTAVGCLHGEFLDPWNNQDHGAALRYRLAREAQAGSVFVDPAPSPPEPPPGTRLARTLAPQFERWPWLRHVPEQSIAAPALLILDPGRLSELVNQSLRGAVSAATRRPSGGEPRATFIADDRATNPSPLSSLWSAINSKDHALWKVFRDGLLRNGGAGDGTVQVEVPVGLARSDVTLLVVSHFRAEVVGSDTTDRPRVIGARPWIANLVLDPRLLESREAFRPVADALMAGPLEGLVAIEGVALRTECSAVVVEAAVGGARAHPARWDGTSWRHDEVFP